MKKYIKMIFIVVGTIIVFGIGYAIYIGNYLYDYTLNPHSQHNISEKIETNQKTAQRSRQWLKDNSEMIQIESYDHLRLNGYFIDQDNPVYVIMVHGYRGDGASILTPIKQFKKQGYNLLIPDLRGHGLSEGNYIGMGWDDRLDIMAWIDMLIEYDEQASIVLYGVSMGGATVMDVAGETLPTQVKAIIEDCGYTSVWDVFKAHIEMNELESELALHMASFITKLRAGYYLQDVKPIEQVKKSRIPILFIHGENDHFVPVKMAEELYQATSALKEKLIIKGASHANSCAVDPQLYYETIFSFIKKYI